MNYFCQQDLNRNKWCLNYIDNVTLARYIPVPSYRAAYLVTKMARGRRPLSKELLARREQFGKLLRDRREQLHKELRPTARQIRPDFDHTWLARIEKGQRPVPWPDSYGMADAYEVPWEALVLAYSGQLSLPLSETAAALRDQHLEDRTERFDIPLTSGEKRQLEMFLGYLRFVQDRQDVLSVQRAQEGHLGNGDRITTRGQESE